MQVTVEFQGMAQLIQRLKTMPAAIQADADAALENIAIGMADHIRRQYPRGPTGNLKRGVRARRLGPMAWQVRAGAGHTHLYEFGTKMRKNKRGANRGRMPRFGPIFGVEKMRRQAQMRRDLTNVLRTAARGAGSAGGVGML